MRAAYATWVVEGPRTPACYNFHNRDVNMRVMVYLSWGFIVLNWWVEHDEGPLQNLTGMTLSGSLCNCVFKSF